jgi:membrane-associated phospholipid phosphatase
VGRPVPQGSKLLRYARDPERMRRPWHSRIDMTSPSRALHRVDTAVLRRTRRALGGTQAVPAARARSHLGEHAVGRIALGGLGRAVTGRRREWATGIAGVVAAHGAGVVVKRVVRRQRPVLADVPALVATPSRLSFPSAHSCSTAAAVVGYGPLLGTPLMGGATGLMLVSRVLLGVHHPSDVVSGAVLGAGVAAAVRRRLVPAPAGRACPCRRTPVPRSRPRRR